MPPGSQQHCSCRLKEHSITRPAIAGNPSSSPAGNECGPGTLRQLGTVISCELKSQT
jgi:hypothetical protein